jgi:GNAT superfamily N-acetyltransferase
VLLAAYQLDMRRHAWVPGLPVERLADVSRYYDADMREALIMWHDFPAEVAESVVQRELAFFANAQGFTWKLYAGDGPPNLREVFERNGMQADEECALMVARAEDIASQPPIAAEWRSLAPHEMVHLSTVWEAVWPDENGGWVAVLTEALERTPERLKVVAAFDDGMPVATAYLGLDPRGQFAYLGGGSVLPSHRGRGLYRALVQARARMAHAAGTQWLAVEARPASRGVLERTGFTVLNTLDFFARADQRSV